LASCLLRRYLSARYGRFLGDKWSEHENQKSEIQKSKNHKSIIY
jgi:hypothetical protein